MKEAMMEVRKEKKPCAWWDSNLRGECSTAMLQQRTSLSRDLNRQSVEFVSTG